MDSFILAEMILLGMGSKPFDRKDAQLYLFGQYVVLTYAEIDQLLDDMHRNGMIDCIGSNPSPFRLVYVAK